MYTVGIITSSDKGYVGEREDKSGELIKEIVESQGFEVKKYTILPDEPTMLAEEMVYMCDDLKVIRLLLLCSLSSCSWWYFCLLRWDQGIHRSFPVPREKTDCRPPHDHHIFW